jgi:hypothetical protein
MKHSGRPNPASLGFIAHQLRQSNRDQDAEIIESLQEQDLNSKEITHLLFTFSGNEPIDAFADEMESPVPGLERLLVGIVVTDHQSFIADIFGRIDGANS